MITRRKLVAGIGAFAFGCPVSAASEEPPEQWTRTFDVIVAGGGGAGLAAAVSAAQNKASVLLVEKMPMLGGDTLRSTGYLSCVEPRRQQLNGVRDSQELHYRQTMRSGQNRGNPHLVRTMVREAPETVAWLEELGVVFQDAVYEIYGSDYRRCLKPLLPRGSAYVRALSQKAAALGVHVLLETPLTDLCLDESARAVGILTRNARDKSAAFGARRGIVLATGGFGANREMVARHAPVLAGLPTDNSPGSTGDVLLAAPRHGIALEGLEYVECVAGNPPGRKTHARLFLPADFVLVNEQGARFVEEDALRVELTKAILNQSNRRCFTVFDQQGVDRLDPISQKGLYQALVADEAWRADSLGELAGMMRVPVRRLENEIALYNSAAAQTDESGNGKCSRVGCTPLVKPPFWAYEVGLTVHYTPGGLRINEQGLVMKTDGSPVKALWAAGETTGSVHGVNRLGGNGLADAFTFGRLWGQAAAKNNEN